MALTPKEASFVDEYLIDFNASAAARRAGYKQKAIGQHAHLLLKKPEIASRIAAKRERISAKAQATAERVAEELARIAFANPADFLVQAPDGRLVPDFRLMNRDDMAAISSLEFEGGSLAGKSRKRLPKGRKGRSPVTGLPRASGGLSKIRFWDKPTALRMLGTHYGMFLELPPPPPPPSDDSRRATIINILVQTLDRQAGTKAGTVIIQPPSPVAQPRLSTPAAELAAAKRATKL